MTLQELMDKVPAEARPLVTQYGPALIAMTADQLQAWLRLVFLGKTIDAYAMVLKATPDAGIDAELDQSIANWKEDNAANAKQKAMAQEIAIAVCKGLLTVVLALVGL